MPYPHLDWVPSLISQLDRILLPECLILYPSERLYVPLFETLQQIASRLSVSPLLFLIIADGLSRYFNHKKSSGALVGVKIIGAHHISQVLFVDDILLFGRASIIEAKCIDEILNLFT